jgi:hypothetical protein
MDGALLRTCIETYFRSNSVDVVLLQPLRVALSRDNRSAAAQVSTRSQAYITLVLTHLQTHSYVCKHHLGGDLLEGTLTATNK